MNLLENRYVPLVRTCIVKERLLPYGKESVCTPQKVVQMLKCMLRNVDKEYFIVISVDAKNKPVGIEVVSVGTLTATLVEAREVFKHAVLCCASGIIMAHNHPSGDVMPSNNDLVVSKKMREAGEILGIRVLDHIIIGEDDYFSFEEKGMWN